ncbi:MAG: hypothetical protein H0V67_01110 [Geodermatophilaceae bacterium]|nr:hypothetical protein [Geodermatophilaceae bacterium]
MTVLALLGVAFVSALVPVVNLEVYLGAMALFRESGGWWPVAGLGLVAAVGQLAGKTLFYFAGRGVITLPKRFRKPVLEAAVTTERPRRERTVAAMKVWRQRVEDRPWLSVVFVGTSASVGLPPFALVSVAAGALRIPLPIFLIAGLAGRWARFVTVLALVQVSTG